MKWLLLLVTTQGHVNAYVDNMQVRKFATEQECETERIAIEKRYYRTKGVCFSIE